MNRAFFIFWLMLALINMVAYIYMEITNEPYSVGVLALSIASFALALVYNGRIEE